MRTPQASHAGKLAVTAAGLALCWVALCLVTFALIQRYANQEKERVAAELSARLGRPVHIGHIEIRWPPRFGADVAGVTVGAAAGEPGPALEITRARVRLAFVRALMSFGYSLHVEEAALEGVTARVVRAPDGALNWQRIAGRLHGDQPARPASPALRDRLQRMRIDRVSVDGQVLFSDGLNRAADTAIRGLRLTAAGARLDAPFEAHLEAAVLAHARNLDLVLAFQPPAGEHRRAPALARVTLRLQPVELRPLAPFLAAAGGELEQGALSADLTVEPGAAAPGGRGPSLARGTVRLTGARLGGGERFDVAFDADVHGDADAGSVEVNRFRLAVGEMAVEAGGRLLDLAGAPRFDGFTLTSRGLDFGRLRRYDPGLIRRAGLELAGPFSVAARASASGGEQRFTVDLDLSSASIASPGKLDKPAGAVLTVHASGRAEGQTIRCDELRATMGEAKLQGRGVLHPPAAGGRPYEVSVEAPSPFSVRAVAALAGAGGRVPDARLSGRVAARGRLGHPEALHVEVPSFSAAAGASQVTGSLTVENLEHPRITLDARAPFLDVEDFRPPHQPSRREPGSFSPRADGRLRLDVARGRAAGIAYQDLHAELALADGKLRAHTLEVAAFGGRFSGSGSELPVDGQGAPFRLAGTVAGVDVGALLARFAPGSRALGGRLDARVDLTGRGTTPAELARSLGGTIEGTVADAELSTTGLLAPVLRALGDAVKVAPLSRALGEAERRLGAVGDRQLGAVAAAARFADGALVLGKPLQAHPPYGAVTLDGRIPLDGRADLHGTIALAPEALSTILGRRLDLGGPLPVEVRVTGPLTTPHLAPVRIEAPARILAGAFARSAAAGLVPQGSTAGEGVRRATEAAGRRLQRLLPR